MHDVHACARAGPFCPVLGVCVRQSGRDGSFAPNREDWLFSPIAFRLQCNQRNGIHARYMIDWLLMTRLQCCSICPFVSRPQSTPSACRGGHCWRSHCGHHIHHAGTDVVRRPRVLAALDEGRGVGPACQID